MANKKFTEEEIARLQESPYVLKATPSQVHFSTEFKRKFWEALCSGAALRDIVIEMGLDPDVLGAVRLNGLKTMIQNEVKSGKGFRDITTYSEYLNGYVTPEVKIKHLEHQLAYKDQEIEFLKKIVSLGKGGLGS